jgi:signal transduction histidine kinase
VVSAAWILLSGLALDAAVGDDNTLHTWLEYAKGLGFVAVTGAILLFAIRRYAATLHRANENARRMARFAELSPNPVLEFGIDGEVVSANRAAHRAAASLGVNIQELLPGNAQELVRECMTDRKHLAGALHTLAGRSWRWAFFPADAPAGAYAYGYDRTQEAGLELQVEHAARMESVGRLAAGVAHDLNNILMAVGGFRSIIQMRTPPDDPAHEDLDGIREQLDRAQDLVQKLLLVARTRSTGENVTLMDLSEHLESVVATVRHLLPYRVQLEVEIGPGPLPIEVNIREFEQALLNLAGNAVDSISGDGVVRLTVHETRSDHICVEVTDSGEGIPPDVLPRIFDPFFTTKDEGHGTGLGLASVYAFAVRSGGSIQVESQPGAGASFRIFLPRARA